MRQVMPTCAVLSIVVASPSHATETPKDRYDTDTVCFAVTREAASAPGLSATDRDHAASIRPLYAKRLAVSAPAAGKTSANAAQAVAELERSSRANLLSPDVAKVRSELEEMHTAIRDCAALPVFELLDHSKAK